MKYNTVLTPVHPSDGSSVFNNFEANSDRDAIANAIEWARALQNLQEREHIIVNLYNENERVFSMDFTDWAAINKAAATTS